MESELPEQFVTVAVNPSWVASAGVRVARVVPRKTVIPTVEDVSQG